MTKPHDTAALQFYKAAKLAYRKGRKVSSFPMSSIRSATANLSQTLSKIIKTLAVSPQEP